MHEKPIRSFRRGLHFGREKRLIQMSKARKMTQRCCNWSKPCTEENLICLKGSKSCLSGIRSNSRLPCPRYPFIIISESSDSHGWHTGVCCVYMVLVAGFGSEASRQRDSIQKNSEYGIDVMIGQEQIYSGSRNRTML